MLALKQLIDKNNIISFDIFDTLILRNIFQPTDIFRILAKFAKDEFDIDDFFQKRVEGEKKARDKVKNSEADFQEIYDEVEKLCGCNIEKIKQMELQLEMEFSVINPYMMEIWKYASEQKKTIIFISDMYLSSDFIKKLLKKNGYKVEHLYVSNEYRKNKQKNAGAYRFWRDGSRNTYDQSESYLHFPGKMGIYESGENDSCAV